MSGPQQDAPMDLSGHKDEAKVWIPLESDPNLMTDYLRSLTLTEHYLIDVPVIDEAQAEEFGIFTGHKVKAFIFLYELNDRIEQSDRAEASSAPAVPALTHLKQLIHNSCGSVALFHAYLNTVSPGKFNPSSAMFQYYKDIEGKDFEGKGKRFASCDNIRDMHHKSAVLGQSSVPNDEQLKNINYHFVAVVWANDAVYKLDGRLDKPIRMSPDAVTTEAQCKQTGLQAIQKLIQRDPDNYHFSVLAFCGE